jgi:lipopolysaccharide export system permease protein
VRTLTRYIGRDVLLSTLLIFVALIGLFTFFDLINEMRDVGRGSYTITTRSSTSRCTRPRASTSCFPSPR